jgi:hypothetical protein
MGGEFCTEITFTSSVKLIVQLCTTLVGCIALALGVYELYKRRHSKKVTSVLVAVRFAVVSIVMNLLWSLFGVVFIVGGIHGDGLIGPRWLYVTMIVPLTFIFTLTSVVILSLSWRQVVNDWRRYRSHVDADVQKQREERIRKAAIFGLFNYYLIGAIAMGVGRIIIASGATIAFYLMTIVAFIISSKDFHLEINTMTQGSGTTGVSGQGNRLAARIRFARLTSKFAAGSLGVVVVAMIFMAAVLEVLGYPTYPHEVELVTFAVLFLQLGTIFTGVAVVTYARSTRSIGKRSPNSSPGLTFSANTMESYNGSFDVDMKMVPSEL